MEKILTSPSADFFFQALLKIDNIDDMKNFMRDICTISELKSMMERLEIAKRVQNKEPYRKISEEIGASSATITRVAHWLKYGNGGYEKALKEI